MTFPATVRPLQSVPSVAVWQFGGLAEKGLVPVIPGVVLGLDPVLGHGFVSDLLLDNGFRLRRVLDRGLELYSGPGGSLGLDGGLCCRGIERLQGLLGRRLQAGHEGFLIQTVFSGKGAAACDHAVLDRSKTAVLLGNELGSGPGGFQLTLQPAVFVLKVAQLRLHLRRAGDLLLEGEDFRCMIAVLPMPDRLNAPESV